MFSFFLPLWQCASEEEEEENKNEHKKKDSERLANSTQFFSFSSILGYVQA